VRDFNGKQGLQLERGWGRRDRHMGKSTSEMYMHGNVMDEVPSIECGPLVTRAAWIDRKTRHSNLGPTVHHTSEGEGEENG